MKHAHTFRDYDQQKRAVHRRNTMLMPSDRTSPEYRTWMREAAWRLEDFERDYALGRI